MISSWSPSGSFHLVIASSSSYSSSRCHLFLCRRRQSLLSPKIPPQEEERGGKKINYLGISFKENQKPPHHPAPSSTLKENNYLRVSEGSRNFSKDMERRAQDDSGSRKNSYLPMGEKHNWILDTPTPPALLHNL